MDKWLIRALVVAVLLAGTGIFYHFVVFVPGVERNRVAAAERDRMAAAERLQASARTSRETYQACNDSARQEYEMSWATACRTVVEIRHEQLGDCLSDKAILSNQFMGIEYCKRAFATSDSSENVVFPMRKRSQ